MFILSLFVISCNDDDNDEECLKNITIPQFFIVGNQTYSSETILEVPCDTPEPTVPELIEPPELENFSYQILSFDYTPDTGNNTSRLRFEIQLNNGNDFNVNGIPVLTTVTDGLEVSGSYSNNANEPCFEIDANSSCILTFDQESSLDFGAPGSIEITNVVYIVTD